MEWHSVFKTPFSKEVSQFIFSSMSQGFLIIVLQTSFIGLFYVATLSQPIIAKQPLSITNKSTRL